MGEAHLRTDVWAPPTGRCRLGAVDWAPDNWVPCRLGTGHFGAVSSYEEKLIKQAIP